MFGHARADRAPDRFADSRPATRSGVRKVGDGPYDSEDPIAERLGRGAGRVDFGSLRIPIPARAQLQVEKGNGDLLRAVHVLVPSGRVSLSALAAPRSNPLWRGLAGEIGDSLSNDGARVRAEWGEWGREVEAASNGAISRFIGVDGPRWMLYGVATGPADGAEDLAVVLRDMMRGTVVHRGPDPLPVKTVLPLRLPEGLEEHVEQAREDSRARQPRTPAARSVGTRAAQPEPARPERGARPAVPPAREPMPPRRPLAAPPVRGAGRPPAHPEHVPEHAPRPAAARVPAGPAIGSLGRPSAPTGLPPVPAAPVGGGSGMSAAEATWSLANPVVNAAEVAQQPAWASLSAAPSFWPHEHLRPEEPSRPAEPSDPYGSGSFGSAPAGSGSFGIGSFGGSGSFGTEPFGGSGSLESGSLGSGSFGTGSFGSGSFGEPESSGAFPAVGPSPAGDRVDPAWPPAPPGPGHHEGTPTPLERAILAEMSFGAGPTGRPVPPPADGNHDGDPGTGADDGWTGSDSDLLSSTDGLHAVLLNDSAATRGWAASAERRGGRRRREN